MFKWTFTLTLTAGFLALLLIYGLPQGQRALAETPVAGSTAVTVESEAAEEVAAYQAREAQMQAQLSQLADALEERQTAYAQQLAELDARRTALVAGLEQAEGQAAEVAQQVATVQTARNERLGVYQAQVQQAQAEYDARYGAMAQQLTEAEAKLAEANAILGR